MFLSQYLVFKIVLAAVTGGRIDYPTAADLVLKYDSANKLFLSGGALNHVTDITLFKDGVSYELSESLNLDASNEQILYGSLATTEDQFSISLSVDGNYAIIGARQNDTGGTNRGTAYIFYKSGGTWSQQANFQPSDIEDNDNFAYSVDISGDYAIIGSFLEDTGGSSAGAAYIFYRSGTSWTQQAKLTASNAGADDWFGYSVAIDGDYAIVGAYLEDTGGSDRGSVYIFYRSGTSWTQQAQIQASDAEDSDSFGQHVDISGDYVAVGATQEDTTASNAGSVYIFKRSGTSWSQQQKIQASDPEADDNFGRNTSLSGDYLAVGAHQEDTGGSQAGSVYIFKKASGSETWSQEAKLQASDVSAASQFGRAVSLSGNTLAVGANAEDTAASDAGAAYVFSRSGSTWTQIKKITASDAAASDYFGESISTDGITVLVGAWGEDTKGLNVGTAYIYGSQKVTNYYINKIGKYSADLKICGLDYKTNELDITSVTIPAKVVQVISGGMISMALTEDGFVYVWGYDTYGQMGQGTTDTNVNTPVKVKGVGGSGFLSNITKISCSNHCLALASDGTLYSWGINDYGELGDASTTERKTPVVVSYSGDPVSNISASQSLSALSTTTGKVYCWGLNNSGQIGDNTNNNRNIPTQVVGVGNSGTLAGIRDVSCGDGFTHAIKDSDGSVYGWGKQQYGMLGNNANSGSTKTPVSVILAGGSAVTGITQVCGGGDYSLFLKSDGTVYAAGYGASGQLGDGATDNNDTGLVQVLGVGGSGNLTGITQIAALESHSLALKSDGTMYSWGTNTDGQNGLGTVGGTNPTTPVEITLLTGVDTIGGEGKGYNFIASKSDGSVFCWGRGDYGQIGDGTNTADQGTPTQVLAGAGPSVGGKFNLFTEPRLTFDEYNKFSINHGLSGVSSRLNYGSNVYDIGAVTSDIVIEKPGEYVALTTDTWSNKAYFSNMTVSSVASTQKEYEVEQTLYGTATSDSTGQGGFGHYIDTNGDGTRFVLGLGMDPTTGQYDGRVKVYHLENGTWTLKVDIPTPNTSSSRFGDSVCMSEDGTRIAVNHYANGDGTDAKIYIYDYASGAWPTTPTKTISAEDNAGFGDMDMNKAGTVLIAGAGTEGGTHKAHIYTRASDTGNWSLTKTWTDGGNNELGSGVAINGAGTRVLIGQRDNGGKVFEANYDGSSWGNVTEVISTSNSNWPNKIRMDSDGTTCVINADPATLAGIYERDSGDFNATTQPNTGSISGATQFNGDTFYLIPSKSTSTKLHYEPWDTDGDEPTHAFTITKSGSNYVINVNDTGATGNPANVSAPGGSAASTATVSAGDTVTIYDSNGNSGTFTMPTLNGPGWTLSQSILSQASYYSRNGLSISYDGNMVLAGESHNDTDGTNFGRAFLWNKSGGSWSLMQTFSNPKTSPATNDTWGSGVAIAKNTKDRLIIGMPGDNTAGSDYGSVYVHTNAIPDYLDFDTYNKLSINDITPTSTTLKYFSNTYDIGTATNIYIDSAGTYDAEITASDKFAFDSNVVGAVTTPSPNSQLYYPLTSEPSANIWSSTTDVAYGSDGVTFNSTSSTFGLEFTVPTSGIFTVSWNLLKTSFAAGTGVIIASSANQNAPELESTFAATSHAWRSTNTGYVSKTGLTHNTNQWYHMIWVHDKNNGLTAYLDGVEVYSYSGTISSPQTSFIVGPNYRDQDGSPGTNQFGAGAKMSDIRIYNTAISSTEAELIYKADNKYIPKFTFDGFNKYTFTGADTGSTYKLKYESNTYDIGTASNIYIEEEGTYDIEMKNATTFALFKKKLIPESDSKKVVFHHGAFTASDYSSAYSTVSAAATAGHVYSDTSAGTYTWGTLAAPSTTSSNTTYTWTPASTGFEDANVLMVAGGGGGSYRDGGGGGAGGLVYKASQSLSGAKTIVVGAGGDKGTSSSDLGDKGNNTTFTGFDNAIGGGGGNNTFTNNSNKDGGSGGGGSTAASGSTILTGGSGTSGQGNAGGNGSTDPGYRSAGAGGGGAGATGGSTSSGDKTGANGGVGLDYSSTFGTVFGDSGFFAGGGGGGSRYGTQSGHGPGSPSSGGRGGGGGGGASSGAAGTSGTKHTGGGGGGGSFEEGGATEAGGDGGSGVVIVKTNTEPITARIVGISAGSAQVAALTQDGSVYMWGTGTDGRLGQGSSDVGNKNTPVKVKGVDGVGFLSNIKQVSCGGTQTLALANDGTIYSWGNNGEGQLGVGDTTVRYYPTVVPYTGEAISKVAAIHKHSLICTAANGYVYACGENQSGQIGDGTSGTNRNTFTQVKGVGGSGNILGITHLSGGNDFSVILNATSGLAYGFGRGDEYQLSTGDNTSTNTTPRNVKTGGSSTNLTGITDISCGEDFSYFLVGGVVYASGEGSAGEQGDGANSDNTSATACVGTSGSGTLSGISNILGTKTCGFARKSDGTLYVWGDNTHGQFASGSASSGDTHTPTEITSITGVEDIQSYGRGTHLIARKSDGSVFCWGDGTTGQIGNGANSNATSPTQVLAGAGPSVDGKFNLNNTQPKLKFDGYNKLTILDNTSEGQLWPPSDGTWNITTDNSTTSEWTISGASYGNGSYKATSSAATNGIFRAYQAFEGTETGNTSCWQVIATSGILSIEFPYEVVIDKYALLNRNYNLSEDQDASPKDFTFEGSSDGSSWAVLDTVTGNGYYTGQGGSGQQTFTISNTTAYKHYRLNVTANNGDSGTVIGELKLLAVNNSTNLKYFSNTYDIGTATNIYIENTGTYSAEIKGATNFALSSNIATIQTVTQPTLVSSISITASNAGWGSYTYEHQSTNTSSTYYEYKISEDPTNSVYFIAYNWTTNKWYDTNPGTTHSTFGTSASDTSSTSRETTANPAVVYVMASNSLHAQFINPYFLGPSLDFDTYNKLSINGITPTSSTLKYGSNTYDIGTSTNIYVENTGVYTAEIGGAADFALTSNTVSGTIKTIEPGFASRYQGSMALTYDGKLYAWGMNDDGEAGVGTSSDITVPTLCTGITQGTVAKLLTSSELTDNTRGEVSAIKTIDGKIYMAGKGDNNCIPGKTSDQTSFTDVTSYFGDQSLTANTVTMMSFTDESGAALTETGNVWTWGTHDSEFKKLGQAGASTSSTPKQINFSSATDNITKITSGHYHNLALDSSGDVWFWGKNGVNSTSWPSSVTDEPQKVVDGKNIIGLASSYGTMYAFDATGKMWNAGNNYEGQIGDGTTTANSSGKTLTEVTYFSSKGITINKVYGGAYFVFVDTSDGYYCWGNGGHGPLGNGSTGNITSGPAKWTNVSNIKKFMASTQHTTAITEDGKYYAWGRDYHGSRGDSDSSSDISYPKYIKALPNILAYSFEHDGYDKVFVGGNFRVIPPFVINFHRDGSAEDWAENGYAYHNITNTAGGPQTFQLRDSSGTANGDGSQYNISIDFQTSKYVCADVGSSSPHFLMVGDGSAPSSLPTTTTVDLINSTDYLYIFQSNSNVNGYSILDIRGPLQRTKFTKNTVEYDAGNAKVVTVSDSGTYDTELNQGGSFTLKSTTIPATSSTGLYTWAFHHGNFDNAYGDGDILTARDNGRFYADTPAYTGAIGTITPGGFGGPISPIRQSGTDADGASWALKWYYDESVTTSNNDGHFYYGESENNGTTVASGNNGIKFNYTNNTWHDANNSSRPYNLTYNTSNGLVEYHEQNNNNGNAYFTSPYFDNKSNTTYTFAPPSGGLTANVLMVAGGGGGGGRAEGGGGGAGGLVYTAGTSLASGATKTIVVGNGDSGGIGSGSGGIQVGFNGKDTTFTDLTSAIGGGGGASQSYSPKSGGSGGGGNGGNGSNYIAHTGGHGIWTITPVQYLRFSSGYSFPDTESNWIYSLVSGSWGGDLIYGLRNRENGSYEPNNRRIRFRSGENPKTWDTTSDGFWLTSLTTDGNYVLGNDSNGTIFKFLSPYYIGSSVTSSQGTTGGNGATTLEGGGGGGAGGVGANASSGNAGDGGIGKFFGTGSSFTDFGDEYGEGGYFAGGGGGGNRNEIETIPGGRGGGGYGGNYNGYMARGGSLHGMVHTGGGGGGVGTQARDQHPGYNTEGDGGVRGHGGRGGSGIVLIQTNVAPPNGANTAVVQVGNPRRRSLPPAVDHMGSEVNRFYIIDSQSMPTYKMPTHWYMDPPSYDGNHVYYSAQGTFSPQKRADGGTSNVWYATSAQYFADYGTKMAQSADAVFMPVEAERYSVLLSIGANAAHDIQLEMAADGTAKLYRNNGATLLQAGTITCFTVGKWHHVALTVDSEHNAVGYVNGHPVVSTRYTSNPDVGSREGNMHMRVGVSGITFRKFLTYEVSTYNFHMSPKQVLQRAAEVGLGPKLEYDSLNTLTVVNTERGSSVTIYESNVHDTSNIYAVSCDSSYTLSNAATYYAEIKGTNTYTITRPLTITDDHFPLYQYPPTDGTTSSITGATAANSFNNYWTISGAANGNGQYQVKCNTAADNNHYNAWRNNVGSDNQWQTPTNPTYPISFTILLPSAKTIRKYRMFPLDHDNPNGSGTSATPGTSIDPTLPGNGGDDATKRPKSWVLKGSNNDSSWTDLDTVTNKPISIYGDVYSIDSPASYLYYQVEITANNGGNKLLLGDIQLWGDA